MRRPALYSSSSRTNHARSGSNPSGAADAETQSPLANDSRPSYSSRLIKQLAAKQLYLLWSVVGLMALLLALSFSFPLRSTVRQLTQEDINAAVLKTLDTTTLPSPAAKAYEAISPSVVRVVGMGQEKGDQTSAERSVGTGVVIVDKGVILTNLHVVQGAKIIKVTFADGLESIASLTGVQPENDLAVLQAHTIPDDLPAATLRSTADLAPGDQVMVVGYPFGIGPSASSGVISGLQRTFRSPGGKQQLSNLIQFDAAANPGNSGGPLVTMDGEVIGIVTAIYNPNQQRTFIGIGFAVPIENAASAAGLSPF
ncbi:MAG: trypsin-like serine protease [Polaromonas sp.]|uniref:S1C family serine protease n=1 Tax=Polaromonas sp. TaxID=1869339 RepID=UPI00179E52BD|nr:trypsin-like peptidase domain-containing protein [Polaromonas sp.]NMM10174.1 trypsin-like serine protease [Polaromonas sp.]